MALIVMKFGGSSVADTQRLYRVAERITNTYKEGNDVVVVLSAQGDTTDELIAKAEEVNLNGSKREMDMLLACGEQMSVALEAMAIQRLGCPVVSLNAWQVGIHTDSRYSGARIRRVDASRIRMELDRKRIVLVTGFQGISPDGDLTTLGRGGSDTSAVALAVALKADLCQIFTDVDGVYTADPRLVSNAKKLQEITYDEMLELASLGAQVLHNRSVEMAKRYHVDLEVLTSFANVPGTIVKEVVKMEKVIISGVAKDCSIARIALVGLNNEPGVAYQLFSLLAKKKIDVDVILQSIGRGDSKDISFTVDLADCDEAAAVLEANRDELGFDHLDVRKDVAKVSIVGGGMLNTPGIAAAMFQALYEEHINIQMISTSEIKVSVLIDKAQADRAVRAIHSKFFD